MLVRYHCRRNWLRYIVGVLFSLCIVQLGYIQHLNKGFRRVPNDPYDLRFGHLSYKSPEIWDDSHQTFLRNANPVPVHSHNDYERNIPLFEALGSGCISVEADIHLRGSKLLVGHSRLNLKAARTLEALYLDPLQRMISAQNDGLNDTWRGLFDKAPKQTLALLIDFKTKGAPTFDELNRHLQPLRDLDYLTYWNGTARITRPLTIVLSGNAPFESVLSMNSTHRDIFWDAKLERLVSAEDDFNTSPPTYRFNTSNSYFASTRFQNAKFFRSNDDSGLDVLPEKERDMTATQIEQAKSRGLLARYWDTPKQPPNVRDIAWRVLIDNEIGMLNMDDMGILQVLYRCAESFSLHEMMQVCFANKTFYQMGMEAIYESDILQDAVYWDPVRGTKVFYEKIVEDEGYTYPCLLDEMIDTDNEDDYDYLPRYFRAQAQADDDEAELLTNTNKMQFVPSNEFWIRFLTARTLGKIRTKPPTEDHLVLKAIAEQMMHYVQLLKSPCIATQQDAIRIVCEVAVKHGFIYDRRDFFIGKKSLEKTSTPSDETCCVIRDGLLGVAVYINEPDIFKAIISKEQVVKCPEHSQDSNQPSDRESSRVSNFTYPWTRIDNEWIPKSGFQPPECGRSLIRLSNTVTLAVQTDNMTCASLVKDSLPEISRDRDYVISDIIKVSRTPDKLKWLQYAINSCPTLTKFNIVTPNLRFHLDHFGRTGWGTRKHGAKDLSEILDTTTSLEVFDVAYNAIMEGYNEEEGVWWTKMTYKHEYAAHNIRSWGTARIHRAVFDDCMPIVKRLVELGYHLGPNFSSEDLEDETVQTLVDSEKPRDISLPLAVSRGDMDMVQLLFQIGAERNRKNVRKAIWIAMEKDRRDMLEVLMEKGHPDGLLNHRLKKIWIQKLKAQGKEDMLPWVDKISGRQDELISVYN
ncbi:uncharacterized protein FIESC28_08269 [Fusarium coffeatum]|uniref:Altered inheritance of mitochondria protein 6 n=1 Tax=Fusarium coffeatum TaxID=231269 RepID=A0A366R836_9HYPO|nr:uncharacterized protein FIESC28_08269 [Fusarium coffeatum]RBR13303.1 hypothetical protein FIESC28_08269 [Fusarium coffeatum]